jgi:non-ribosomal peptide synthetase component F
MCPKGHQGINTNQSTVDLITRTTTGTRPPFQTPQSPPEARLARSESRRDSIIREFLAWLLRKHAGRHGWTVVCLTLAIGCSICALLLGGAAFAIYAIVKWMQ